jgi:hypothetical protein
MAYTHKTGTVIKTFNSHEEHCFYEDTTKRQMFLIIEQMAEILKRYDQTWVEKATEERELLKNQNIK